MSGRNSGVQQTAHYKDARLLCTPVRGTHRRPDGTGSRSARDLQAAGATRAGPPGFSK